MASARRWSTRSARSSRSKSSKNGKIYFQRYERGAPEDQSRRARRDQAAPAPRPPSRPTRRFSPKLKFKYEIIARYLREMAYLNAGLQDPAQATSASARPKSFTTRAGSRSTSRSLSKSNEALHDVIFFKGVREGVDVEVALQWTDAIHEVIFTYANNIHTAEGGTHLSGLKSALTRTINIYATKNNLFKNKEMRLEGDDTREGLAAIVSVKIAEPQFEGQTKTKLGNSEVEGIVSRRWSTRSSASSSRKIPPTREEDRQRARSRPPPRARPRAKPRTWCGARARSIRARCRASSPIARSATRRAASCSSSRATRQAASAKQGRDRRDAGDPAAARQNSERRARADRQGAVVGRSCAC